MQALKIGTFALTYWLSNVLKVSTPSSYSGSIITVPSSHVQDLARCFGLLCQRESLPAARVSCGVTGRQRGICEIKFEKV